MNKIITITTDFGDDFSIAQMYGSIYNINPEAKIVTASNEIEPYNIKQGAFVIDETTKHFPIGTIHVGVIDPGVGTSRRGIAVIGENAAYVGPDNGLFQKALSNQKILVAIELDIKRINNESSTTFHGRDVFARVAAHLSIGQDHTEFGEIIDADTLVPLEHNQNEVLYIDDYGNIKINNPANFEINKELEIKIKNNKQVKASFKQTFGEVPHKNWLCYKGSNKLLELAINQGNAAKELNLKVGDTLEIF